MSTRLEAAPDTARGVARYLQIARSLERAIADGTYPVGSLLPTELTLAERFGVSRQTVRQAIGHLRQQRQVSPRKRVGTRVDLAHPARGYANTLQTLPELFQYAASMVFHATRCERVVARGPLATDLGCRAGRAWIRLDGTREAESEALPVCALTVFVDARYEGLVSTPRTHRTAIFAQIEQQSGEAIVEVRQEIEAVLLGEAEASLLRTAAGGPGLRITRRFLAPGGRMVELSRSVHPAARFRYATTLRRGAG